jgi:hypothetical protein
VPELLAQGLKTESALAPLGQKQVCERVRLGSSDKRIIPKRRGESIIESSGLEEVNFG